MINGSTLARSPSQSSVAVRTMCSRLRRQLAPVVAGGGVTCWRCGQRIAPGQAWDLGHRVDVALGGNPFDVAPEHRWRTPSCPGNRSAGTFTTVRAVARRRAATPRW
jgi:hypothetical protein